MKQSTLLFPEISSGQVVTDQQKGLKYDAGKDPMELLDFGALRGVSRVLGFGARKYAAHNWRGGLQYSRLLGATLRHLAAYSQGEDLDPETGLPHIDHALCELMFLSAFIHEGRTELDDRYITKQS